MNCGSWSSISWEPLILPIFSAQMLKYLLDFQLGLLLYYFPSSLILTHPTLVFPVQHYASIMKYISQPPLLLDVHIHKPLLPARTWMDSLLAFFPGLQVWSDRVAQHPLWTRPLSPSHTLLSYCACLLRCWKETSALPLRPMRCSIKSPRSTTSYQRWVIEFMG